MFTANHKIQSLVCLIIAAVIVGASLSLRAFETERVAHQGYSVTITELQ